MTDNTKNIRNIDAEAWKLLGIQSIELGVNMGELVSRYIKLGVAVDKILHKSNYFIGNGSQIPFVLNSIKKYGKNNG